MLSTSIASVLKDGVAALSSEDGISRSAFAFLRSAVSTSYGEAAASRLDEFVEYDDDYVFLTEDAEESDVLFSIVEAFANELFIATGSVDSSGFAVLKTNLRNVVW